MYKEQIIANPRSSLGGKVAKSVKRLNVKLTSWAEGPRWTRSPASPPFDQSLTVRALLANLASPGNCNIFFHSFSDHFLMIS